MSAASLANIAAARWAISAVFLLNGTGIGFWAVHIPSVQQRLALDEGVLGLVLLCIAAGAMFAMPLAGAAASRFGTRRITTLCAFAFALSIPLPIVAPSFLALIVAAVIFGVCNGALDVAMNAHASEVEHALRRPTMSSFHAFFSLGGLLGAGMGGVALALEWADGRDALALSMTSVLVLILAARKLLRAELSVHEGSHFGWPRRPAIALGLLALLCMAVEGAVADWSALLLAEGTGASPSFAAVGYSAFSIVMAVSRFAGDSVVSRIGARRLVLFGGLSIAAGLLVAAVSPFTVLSAAGFALVGLGAGNVVPVIFAASGRVPGISASAGVATAATIGYVGFLLGPPVIGWLAEHIGIAAALGVLSSAGFLIAAAARATEPVRKDSDVASTRSEATYE